MNKLDAEKAVESKRIVRVWVDWDAEYLCKLIIVDEGGSKWRGAAVVVGVHRILNGPRGWRVPLAEGTQLKVWASQVRSHDGVETSWRDSAIAAVEAEVKRMRAWGSLPNKEGFVQQAEEVLRQLREGEKGRAVETKVKA